MGAIARSEWPADERTPLYEGTVGDVLREAAREAPGAVALVEGLPSGRPRRRWTYEHLLDDAERTARALLGRFAPGERVAVWAPNLPEWVVLELAAALAGLVLVTANPALQAREIAYLLRQSRANGIFLARNYRGADLHAILEAVRPDCPELREVVPLEELDAFAREAKDERLPEVAPGDAVQIQYTSGTTGFPKGALLTHRGVVNNARFCAERLGVQPAEAWVNPMPLFHTGGCVLAALGTVAMRATHVLPPGFDPALVLELVASESAAILGGVPTMLIAELESPAFPGTDCSRLRAVLSGGSTVPSELVRRVEAQMGVQFGIVFGQTECSPVITQTRLDDSIEDKAGTIGQPLPQTAVRIVDPATGEVVPPGVTGELHTRGYHVMLGYFEMPEATAEAIDAEGWLRTGDLCSMDERGYFRVEGRLKDVIIRGGENIYPREIEELLFAHPGVSDVAVVGLPDERWGEVVAAFVRPAPGGTVTGAELEQYLRPLLARHKIPREWHFVEDFPLTPSGKIQKYVLKERYGATRRSTASAKRAAPPA
jgi:fatty-acyl-CoA synthase